MKRVRGGLHRLRIATYNVNSINARLPSVLAWLEQTQPDVVCLQELKAPQEKFPEAPLRDAGYGAIWHGQKSYNGVAILARNAEPAEIRRELPGDPEDTHSRYIEATIDGVLIGCLYLPNGNPAPGPKFDYKLRWLERLARHAAELVASEAPVVLAGDYNVIPTEQDVYKPERWVDDALFRPETREAFGRLVAQGWTDAIRRLHPDEQIYTFLGLFPQRVPARRRAAHRPSPIECGRGRAARSRRRRQARARLGETERSCADVDRAELTRRFAR